MVCLAPPLQAVLEIRLLIENGNSVSQAIRLYSQRNGEEDLAKELGVWLFAQSAGKKYENKIFDTFYRKRLLEILNQGLKGEAVLSSLSDLEEDLIFISNEDLEQHIQKLPLISLIPLMLFEFPAFFLLLAGPLLLNLLYALQN
ncbi:MAG: hypothetical protein OXJ52_08630 [Oligoflexia bacterium]|nr:hypothetical protein [Oligoflexia bacterium]